MKTKLLAGKLRLSLNVSPAFTQACQQAGIDESTALQHFINAVEIYQHLTAPTTATPSLASQLLNACCKQRPKQSLNDNRNTIAWLDRLLEIHKCGRPIHLRRALHNQLLNEWYGHLFF